MVLLGSFGCSEKDLANLIWIPNYRTLASYLISLESSLSIYRIRNLQHISFGDSEDNMNFLPLSHFHTFSPSEKCHQLPYGQLSFLRFSYKSTSLALIFLLGFRG